MVRYIQILRGGSVEKIVHSKEKGMAEVTFVEANDAMRFLDSTKLQEIWLADKRLSFHKGPATLTASIFRDAVRGGACRTLLLSNFDHLDEVSLREDFGGFGDIERILIDSPKSIATIEFTSIAAAILAIQSKKLSLEYFGYTLQFGHDRCSDPIVVRGDRVGLGEPMRERLGGEAPRST